MGLASGVHHLAISTADMKSQLTFFTDVLGAELKALYWMHGVPNARHGFVKLNDSSYIAFVEMPAIAQRIHGHRTYQCGLQGGHVGPHRWPGDGSRAEWTWSIADATETEEDQ